MATTTTDSGFYWYLRVGPKVNTIGLINEDGDVVDSNLTVELHTELADDTNDWSDDAEMLIPDRYLLNFVDGVINRYMHTVHGQFDPILESSFQKGLVDMRAVNRVQKHVGDRMKPLNMRGDKNTYTFTRSENE